MALAFQLCESHPGRLLTDHLCDVADRLRARHAVPTWLPLAGLFHDLGKATEYFQAYLQGQDVPPELKRHAEMGALWLLEFLRQQHLAPGKISPVDTALAFLFVRRHHGRLDDLLDSLAFDQNGAPQFQQQLLTMDMVGIQQWFANRLGSFLPVAAVDRNVFTELRVKSRLALQGIKNDTEAMNRLQSILRWFGFLIECDRDSAAGYAPGQFDCGPKLGPGHIDRFRAMGDFGAGGSDAVRKARELVFQSATSSLDRLSRQDGSLWTLTVPTGSGKTLAALGWAVKRREARIAAGQGNCPIIYTLPFTSIIDQNAAIIRRIFGDISIDESSLAIHHHIAEAGEIALSGEESLARSWVEGWRADIVCTTFVQVVNALFHGTTADARRLSRLAGSILILDEVQAFPAELWPILKTALNSLCKHFNTDILLVTATQPALFSESEKIEIGPNSMPAEVSKAFDRYDFSADLANTTSLDSLRHWVGKELTEKYRGSCLIILNTVGEALGLYALLETTPEFHDYARFHLSTNLRPKDRNRILEEIRCTRGRHILIATQVVEAGVDLSFDMVFRALAPMDAIVQAAGRCNRHGIGQRGLVCVFDLEGRSGVSVYGPVHMGLARETLLNVADKSHPLREPELMELVNQYFLELDRRIGRNRTTKVFEAVRMLQFAALRGEGEDRDKEEKRVQLIDDGFDRVPHFVETDESDAYIWSQLLEALKVSDLRLRQQRLRALRSKVAQRIVEVPKRYAIAKPDPTSNLVHVPFAQYGEFYDTNTGWRRCV